MQRTTRRRGRPRNEQLAEGYRLRGVRQAAELSLRVVAERLGIHKTTLSRWETGTGLVTPERLEMVKAACAELESEKAGGALLQRLRQAQSRNAGIDLEAVMATIRASLEPSLARHPEWGAEWVELFGPQEFVRLEAEVGLRARGRAMHKSEKVPGAFSRTTDTGSSPALLSFLTRTGVVEAGFSPNVHYQLSTPRHSEG